ncbi:DUF6115 domain-containing protein [Pseudothermotoga sp. U03pept]|uniref:DUF6115 domain-containing protein n=1 Tax=Pseudothermotoga sp. U03pept TaxID=3447012 RepID=UPI003F0B4354
MLSDFFSWVVFLSSLGTVAFAWGLFLSKMGRTSPKDEEYENFEERIVELMGQFRQISSVRLQMLDKKIEELRKLIKEANNLYASLCIQETKIAEKIASSDEPQSVVVDAEEYQEPAKMKKEAVIDKEEVVINSAESSSSSVERKILLMYQEGKTEQEIARALGIGVGEVMLILSLFRHRTDHL